MTDFQALQMQFVNALEVGYQEASPREVSGGILPGLADVLEGLPFYQAPDWTAAFRGALARVLALNLPDPTMVYYSTLNELADFTEGYRDAFYAGVASTPATDAVQAMTLARAPSLNAAWWGNYSVAVLNDAVRIKSADVPPISQSALAADMVKFNSDFMAGLLPSVTAALQQAYPPTADPFGLLEDHEAIALQQLTTAIAAGTFTANINQSLAQGGDDATAATWFLYELWLLLSVFGATSVDQLIAQFQTEGLTVPAQVGAGAWATYAAWYPALTGDDVLPTADALFNADLPDVANPGYVIPYGYSYSVGCWGPINVYYHPNEGDTKPPVPGALPEYFSAI